VLYVAVALSSFRRYSTYTAATLAGIFTNSVFGVIISFSYIAVWKENPRAGGYDVTDALTYCWLAQAMIMTIAIWNGGTTDDVAERIRTGDVAIDLYRPVSFLGWFLAGDLGRAAYHLLTRGVAPTVVGALLFDLHFPSSPLTYLAFLVSVALGVVVSFSIRMLVATSAFWLLDQSGLLTLSSVFAMFFSGLVVPLVLFPEPFRSVVLALPWSAFVQVPIDIWLGQRHGAGVLGGLAFQAGWGAVLLLACAGLLRLADRRVVVQGG
jgi:ABC-2 type transport system permease protein